MTAPTATDRRSETLPDGRGVYAVRVWETYEATIFVLADDEDDARITAKQARHFDTDLDEEHFDEPATSGQDVERHDVIDPNAWVYFEGGEDCKSWWELRDMTPEDLERVRS